MTLTPLHIHTVTPWHLNNHWYQCRNMQCRQWYQRDWWSSFTHALIGWLGTSLTWANYAAGRLARDETGCTHHHTPLAQGYATAWIWNTLYNVIVIYTLGHQGRPAYRVYNPIWLHVLADKPYIHTPKWHLWPCWPLWLFLFSEQTTVRQ